MPFSTKLVTAQPTLLYGAQGSNTAPVQVRNTDSANQVWVGDVSNVSTDGSNSIPLDPGDSVSFDGSISIYAVTAAGIQVIVALIPGGMSFAPGQVDISGPVTAEISGPVTVEGNVGITGTPNVNIQSQSASLDVSAATVDINGVGGFVLPGQLALLEKNVANVVANAGITTTLGPFSVSNYSSVMFSANQVTPSSTAAGAAVCAIWQLLWSDGAGTLVGIDTFSVIVGAACTINVPVKGASVQLALTNNGTVGTLTYFAGSVVLWGDYRQPQKNQVVEYNAGGVAPTITGFTVLVPTSPVGISSWIASLNESTAAASTQFLLPLSLWAGSVIGWYQQTGQALAHDATIVDLTYATQGNINPGTGYNFGILQNLPNTVQTAPVNISVNAPPTQLAFLFETGASVGSTFLYLTGAA